MVTLAKDAARLLVDLDGKAKRFEELFSRYGDHLIDCPCRGPMGRPTGCTCGFNNVQNQTIGRIQRKG